MRRFGAACIFFQRVSKNARSDLFEMVALLLSFPCFEASHLCFKVTYLVQKRRALLLCRKCSILGIYDLRLEFDHLPLKRRSIPEAYHSLRNILGRLERTEHNRKGADVGHCCPSHWFEKAAYPRRADESRPYFPINGGQQFARLLTGELGLAVHPDFSPPIGEALAFFGAALTR